MYKHIIALKSILALWINVWKMSTAQTYKKKFFKTTEYVKLSKNFLTNPFLVEKEEKPVKKSI